MKYRLSYKILNLIRANITPLLARGARCDEVNDMGNSKWDH